MKYARSFTELTELQGTRTVLRPLVQEFAKDILAADRESRQELRRFLPWENRFLMDVEAFVEHSEAERAEGTALQMAIFERSRDTLVGVIGLFRLGTFTPRAEVGYWIRTSCTGKGLATDALSTVISYARDVLKLKRLDAKVSVENVASQKVVLKCGFIEEGRQRMAELIHGVWHDHIIYGTVFD